MSILDVALRRTWDSLRARRALLGDYLEDVRLRNLRGMRDLQVRFDYPVSVIAGPNGCGKSTVLFACAAAYAPAGKARPYTPGTLFPDFSDGGEGGFVDETGGTELEFSCRAVGDRYATTWMRTGRSWHRRSFMGRKEVQQPKRALYMRTLSNLTNPSEVRGLLRLGRGAYEAEELTPEVFS